VHVLLGSQTIGGAGGLARSTIGQMAVRIALQCSEADSHMILGDDNSAARLLPRPGEAIYNDAGGLVEANSPFQVAWLPDDQRDVFLDHVNEKVREANIHREPAIVFEGNVPADIRKNRKLAALIETQQKPAESQPPEVKLIDYRGSGDAINDLAHELSRRQSGEWPDAKSVYVLIYGLQRYRVLRHQEESFSFNADEGEKPPATDKQFTELLRE